MSERMEGYPIKPMTAQQATTIGRVWLTMSEQYELAEMREESEQALRRANTWFGYARALAVSKEQP